jgi:hypothetical protein
VLSEATRARCVEHGHYLSSGDFGESRPWSLFRKEVRFYMADLSRAAFVGVRDRGEQGGRLRFAAAPLAETLCTGRLEKQLALLQVAGGSSSQNYFANRLHHQIGLPEVALDEVRAVAGNHVHAVR